MMRFPLVLLLLSLLAGCGEAQKSDATSHLPNSSDPQAANTSFAGTWGVQDAQGQPFEIVLFPNGQAVSTWTKGQGGAKGERGFWRSEGEEVAVFFDDGWTDRIVSQGGQFLHRGFAPDSRPGAAPSNESPARRISDELSAFIGVWQLNKEPDGSYLYVALQASGRAFSTIEGGTEGQWKLTKEGALCTWPDGWNDIIFAAPDGYQKRSWVGPEQNATPPDISPAQRVGEKRFQISP